ncbi:MAG: DUF4139 domain-containing protein [Phycisphaeraceae bacterium]|nr:DUF4139 domain-containing protein [Phycisphaeraceae bacterium]
MAFAAWVMAAVAGLALQPERVGQPAAAGIAGAAGSTAVTIYSSATPGAIPAELYRPVPMEGGYSRGYPWEEIPGYALVREDRTFDLARGRSTVRYTDVASLIEPTTVSFTARNGSATILEQSYQFDLVSNEVLLRKFIDRPISVDQVQGDKVVTLAGTLLSAYGNLVLRSDDGTIQVVNGYSNIRFPALPDGLITRPTLVWDVASDAGGPTPVRVTYQTSGITWWADYNLVFAEGKDANSGTLDVSAWVSILNKSGASYTDATLKLVAGDVQRAPQRRGRMAAMVAAPSAAESAGFAEKSFFEYHLYTLGRAATIPDNATKQIELFDPVHGVPCEKVLVYYGLGDGYYGVHPDPVVDRNFGTQSNSKVDIYLRFKNSKESRMGMPLPSGRIRVNKVDPADGSMEFIGENVIDHTAKDESVLIKLGSAFDVVGERRQVDFKVDSKRRWIEETVEVKVRNHKAEPVRVIIKENMYRWANWAIIKHSSEYEKADSRTVYFPVTLDPDGEATVTYTVKYSW